MFCSECGKELKEGAMFCPECGAKVKVVETVQVEETVAQTEPVYTEPTPVQMQQPVSNGDSVTFTQAVRLYFQNYANFSGRATKAEYWWAFLFNLLVNFAASLIQPIGSLVVLALFIPGLSVGVRRLHDTGKSWVYLLMSFIPIVGIILLIVQFCKESDGDNQWGPATK